jgi:hypothetical protein
MGEYSNSSYSAPFEGEDDDQDTSAAKPIEEGVDQSQSDDPTENVGENQVKHAEEDEENSLRHVENDGEVIGRRNPDLPTEVQG